MRGLRLGLGLSRRGAAAAATPAYQQILDATLALDADSSVYNPDDPDTWTLRESGGTEFYSATSDGLGNRADLVMATEANQPDQVTLSTGARVWARTGGTDRRLEVAITAISQPFTLLFAFRLGSNGTDQRIFDNASVGTGRCLFMEQSSLWQMWSGSFVSGSAVDTDWHIGQLNFDASDELFIDGSSVATGNAGSNDLGGLSVLGRGGGGTQPVLDGGRVGPLIVFPTLKTNAETADIRAILNSRYPIGASE